MSAPSKQQLQPPHATGGLAIPTSGTTQLLGSNLINTGNGSGSATGNPRNKCALKPGFSLMGWVRLGQSGADLTGTGGRITPVSSTELAKHKTRDDAWMAIRGKVYNVTRYMDYHPGGVDELMRGIGRDATLLFNEVHAWVNYEQLLAKCYIGPLRPTMLQIDEDIFATVPKEQTKTQLLAPKPLSTCSIEVVPRFDWIQKRNELTFYFYTRTNCNPGLMLHRNTDQILQVHIQIAQAAHVYNFELQQGVDWPPRAIKVSAGETGKIEVCLRKAAAGELWPSYGTHSMRKESAAEADETYAFEILQRQEHNHDSFALQLRGAPNGNTVICPAIGYHVRVTAVINGESVQRSYTPVPVRFISESPAFTDDASTLQLLIKSYADGMLTPHLRQLDVGATLQLSMPIGGFKLDALLPHRRFAFLAAGSGLTPFLALLEQLLRRHVNRIEHLHLYFFNKTEADIWCRPCLERLQENDARFRLTHVLSQADTHWSGGRSGRLSEELLAPLLNKGGDEHATYVAICGPNGFTQLAKELLLALQFNEAHIHAFQG